MTYVHASENQVLEVFSGPVFSTVETPGEFSGTLDYPQAIEGREGYVVSAAGLEPATHALKGHCSTN
jgi:hypothetical protein